MIALDSRTESPVYNLLEKQGTGAFFPCADAHEDMPPNLAAVSLADRAEYWLDAGYRVEHRDDWFVAKHATEPTVYCVLREAE